METFRCPTCLGVVDASARRCNFCRANIRRKRPKVLGEETRIGATLLPIDRWMLDRMQSDGSGRGRNTMPPVAWHGRFATSPLAEPDFSATPSPVATPLAPPTQTQLPEPAAARTPTTPSPVEEPVETPPVVGALALDMYTVPAPRTDEQEMEVVAPPVAPVPTPEPADTTPPAPQAMVYTPPATTTARPVVAHEELDPEVRALVDDLYEQARAELAGGDLMMMAAMDAYPIEQEYEPFPALDEFDEIGEIDEYALPQMPALAELPELTETADVAADTPAITIDTPVIDTPAINEAPPTRATPPARSRGGWVPAFVADERRRKHL